MDIHRKRGEKQATSSSSDRKTANTQQKTIHARHTITRPYAQQSAYLSAVGVATVHLSAAAAAIEPRSQQIGNATHVVDMHMGDHEGPDMFDGKTNGKIGGGGAAAFVLALE